MAPPHAVTVPAPVAPSPRAGSADITTRPGAVLAVSEGQAVAARVVSSEGGEVELALAGGRVRATTALALEPGQTLRLLVASAGPDRVVLRPDAGSPALADPLAGLPRGAAGTLAATVGQEGLRAGIAADARAAGVATPAAAAAFGRLAAAGLPTGQAAVAGLAQLIDAPPIGASLASLLESLPDGGRTRAVMSGPGAPAAPVPTVTTPASPPTSAVPSAPAAAPATSAPPPAPGAAPAAAGPAATPAPASGAAPVALAPLPGTAVPATAPQVSDGAPEAAPVAQGAPGPAAAPAPGPDHQAIEVLRRLVAVITARTVSGHGDQVAQAASDLGRGLEAHLARGAADDPVTTLRSTLLAISDDPGIAPALARHASELADAIGAQGLAAALPRAGDDATPQTPGAYLQLPLPGGDTVEVRVSPDGSGPGGQREGGTRKLAFLLHLSALGPILIDAVVGPMGAEATIRAQSPDAAAFLARHGEELAQGLREAGLAPRAHVRVERGATAIPQRLVDGPPSSGLDIVA